MNNTKTNKPPTKLAGFWKKDVPGHICDRKDQETTMNSLEGSF